MNCHKDSADYLDFITGGVPLHKIPVEGMEILENIVKYITFAVKPKPLLEERKLSHEDLLAAKSDLSPSTSSYSAIEPRPNQEHQREKKFDPRSSLLNSRMIRLETILTPRISLMPN
jgi:hypothetical protein